MIKKFVLLKSLLSYNLPLSTNNHERYELLPLREVFIAFDRLEQFKKETKMTSG